MIRCKIQLIIFCFLGLSSLYGYQWPSEKVSLVRHFGQSYKGSLNCSLDLDGNFEEVYPVNDGKILFSHSQDDENFPTRSLRTVLIAQSDGIHVIYAGLDSLNMNLCEEVQSQDLLGIRKPGKTLSIGFYDSRVFQYANPLLFLPKVKPNFYQSIVFGGLYLKNTKGISYNVIYNILVPADTYEVYVNVAEIIDGVRLGPYQVELDFMGDIIARVSFDALTASKGQGILRGQKIYFEKELYDEIGNLFLGKLHIFPGQSFITLRFGSVNGLRRQETIRIVSN